MWSRDAKLMKLITDAWVTYYNASDFESEVGRYGDKRKIGAKWSVHTKAFKRMSDYANQVGFSLMEFEDRQFYNEVGERVREAMRDEDPIRNPKDPRLTRAGVSGYNKPKRTPDHPTKSHVVVAKEGDEIRTIRFGQQGVKGSPKKKGESESYRKRRLAFKARHAGNIRRGKLSPAWWADKVKW